MSGGAKGETLELRLQRHVVGLAMAGGNLTPPLERLLTDLTEAVDTLAALRAENARLTERNRALDREREEAVQWIGVVRDEMVLTGLPGGDRAVALGSLRALIVERARLKRDNARLKEVLTSLLKHPGCEDFYCGWCSCDSEVRDDARRALTDTEADDAG